MTSVVEHAKVGTDRASASRLPTNIAWLCGLFIAYLLLASAIAHLDNPYQFLTRIRGYRLMPQLGAEILAGSLPFLHITIALALIVGLFRITALGVASFLFLIYGIAQATTVVRGIEVSCGCFGASDEASLIGIRSVGLAAGACAICLVAMWLSRPRNRNSL